MIMMMMLIIIVSIKQQPVINEKLLAINDRDYLSQRMNARERVKFMYNWQPLQHLIHHVPKRTHANKLNTLFKMTKSSTRHYIFTY